MRNLKMRSILFFLSLIGSTEVLALANLSWFSNLLKTGCAFQDLAGKCALDPIGQTEEWTKSARESYPSQLCYGKKEGQVDGGVSIRSQCQLQLPLSPNFSQADNNPSLNIKLDMLTKASGQENIITQHGDSGMLYYGQIKNCNCPELVSLKQKQEFKEFTRDLKTRAISRQNGLISDLAIFLAKEEARIRVSDLTTSRAKSLCFGTLSRQIDSSNPFWSQSKASRELKETISKNLSEELARLKNQSSCVSQNSIMSLYEANKSEINVNKLVESYLRLQKDTFDKEQSIKNLIKNPIAYVKALQPPSSTLESIILSGKNSEKLKETLRDSIKNITSGNGRSKQIKIQYSDFAQKESGTEAEYLFSHKQNCKILSETIKANMELKIALKGASSKEVFSNFLKNLPGYGERVEIARSFLSKKKSATSNHLQTEATARGFASALACIAGGKPKINSINEIIKKINSNGRLPEALYYRICENSDSRPETINNEAKTISKLIKDNYNKNEQLQNSVKNLVADFSDAKDTIDACIKKLENTSSSKPSKISKKIKAASDQAGAIREIQSTTLFYKIYKSCENQISGLLCGNNGKRGSIDRIKESLKSDPEINCHLEGESGNKFISEQILASYRGNFKQICSSMTNDSSVEHEKMVIRNIKEQLRKSSSSCNEFIAKKDDSTFDVRSDSKDLPQLGKLLELSKNSGIGMSTASILANAYKNTGAIKSSEEMDWKKTADDNRNYRSGDSFKNNKHEAPSRKRTSRGIADTTSKLGKGKIASSSSGSSKKPSNSSNSRGALNTSNSGQSERPSNTNYSSSNDRTPKSTSSIEEPAATKNKSTGGSTLSAGNETAPKKEAIPKTESPGTGALSGNAISQSRATPQSAEYRSKYPSIANRGIASVAPKSTLTNRGNVAEIIGGFEKFSEKNFAKSLRRVDGVKLPFKKRILNYKHPKTGKEVSVEVLDDPRLLGNQPLQKWQVDLLRQEDTIIQEKLKKVSSRPGGFDEVENLPTFEGIKKLAKEGAVALLSRYFDNNLGSVVVGNIPTERNENSEEVIKMNHIHEITKGDDAIEQDRNDFQLSYTDKNNEKRSCWLSEVIRGNTKSCPGILGDQEFNFIVPVKSYKDEHETRSSIAVSITPPDLAAGETEPIIVVNKILLNGKKTMLSKRVIEGSKYEEFAEAWKKGIKQEE